MIITISGMPGSGKSTVARRLSEQLAYKRYYMGAVRRKAARKLGMTLEEFNKKGETDASTDLFVEEYIQKLARSCDNFIIESRTAWAFIPQSLKIFIYVDPREGAHRILKSLKNPRSARARNEGTQLRTYKEVLRSVQDRVQSDDRRYQKYYNLRIGDKKNYDLYLDATNLSAEEEYKITTTTRLKPKNRETGLKNWKP